jgi:hypothetical protein
MGKQTYLYFFACPNIKNIVMVIINGRSIKPKIVDSTPIINEAIIASMRVRISYVLNNFCI